MTYRHRPPRPRIFVTPPLTLDEIAATAGLTVAEVARALPELVAVGLVTVTDDDRYILHDPPRDRG